MSIKSLDTLIEDIYKPLEDLSKGKPLPLSEEDIDIATQGIKNAIMHWAFPEKRNKEFSLRMSNMESLNVSFGLLNEILIANKQHHLHKLNFYMVTS